MSDDTPDDDLVTSETILTPKPQPAKGTTSWWIQAKPDDFTQTALAEVPRMSATREANFVSGNIIVGYLAQ